MALSRQARTLQAFLGPPGVVEKKQSQDSFSVDVFASTGKADRRCVAMLHEN